MSQHNGYPYVGVMFAPVDETVPTARVSHDRHHNHASVDIDFQNVTAPLKSEYVYNGVSESSSQAHMKHAPWPPPAGRPHDSPALTDPNKAAKPQSYRPSYVSMEPEYLRERPNQMFIHGVSSNEYFTTDAQRPDSTTIYPPYHYKSEMYSQPQVAQNPQYWRPRAEPDSTSFQRRNHDISPAYNGRVSPYGNDSRSYTKRNRTHHDYRTTDSTGVPIDQTYVERSCSWPTSFPAANSGHAPSKKYPQAAQVSEQAAYSPMLSREGGRTAFMHNLRGVSNAKAANDAVQRKSFSSQFVHYDVRAAAPTPASAATNFTSEHGSPQYRETRIPSVAKPPRNRQCSIGAPRIDQPPIRPLEEQLPPEDPRPLVPEDILPLKNTVPTKGTSPLTGPPMPERSSLSKPSTPSLKRKTTFQSPEGAKSRPAPKTFDSAAFDAMIYRQPGAQTPPTGISIASPRKTSRQPPKEDLFVYISSNPFIQNMHYRSEAWHAEKQSEISRRGGKKVWFGKVIERQQWLRAQEAAHGQQNPNTEADQVEVQPQRRDPQPWQHQRNLDFGDLAEDDLPDDVKENPAWLKACAWHRQNESRRATRRQSLKRVEEQTRAYYLNILANRVSKQ